jgi:hypothetical protein
MVMLPPLYPLSWHTHTHSGNDLGCYWRSIQLNYRDMGHYIKPHLTIGRGADYLHKSVSIQVFNCTNLR